MKIQMHFRLRYDAIDFRLAFHEVPSCWQQDDLLLLYQTASQLQNV
jgi:hypothetical protein